MSERFKIELSTAPPEDFLVEVVSNGYTKIPGEPTAPWPTWWYYENSEGQIAFTA